MVEYEQVFLGTVQLYPISIQVEQVPRTIKQVVGMSLSQTRIIGSASKQRELTIRGIVIAESGSTVQDKKNEILELDNTSLYSFSDGVHNGNYYIVPASISFDDSGDEHFSISRYTMSLVEE